MLTPEVQAAIDELAANHGAKNLNHFPDGQGGAFVIIEDTPLSPTYKQEDTWIGFHITSACPYADVYPHFVRHDLAREDGRPHGEGLSTGHFFPPKGTAGIKETDCRPAVQVSRKSNKRDNGSNLETPLIKLQKVIRWLNFK